MSLVVAKKSSDRIFIVGDTKLTNPDNLNRIELEAPDEFSAIKTVVINPYVAISFAGEIAHAKTAIAHCRKLNNRITDMLDCLLQSNIRSNGETEFILCVNLPPFFIYEIKNLKCAPKATAWIGDIDGFNEFQKHFLEFEQKDMLSKMEHALTAVIESNVKGVNGFLVTVTNENQYFSYKQYIKTYIPARTYTGNSIIEVYGTVQEGGYTINLFTDGKSDVLAIHFRQNNYGLIYINKDDGYLEPLVYKDVDEHEFNEITESGYRIKPPFLMSSKQKSYLVRGNKQAAQKYFIQAIKFYDLGLKEKEVDSTGHLHFYKGTCQFQLGLLKEAALSFNEAVKVDKAFLSMVVSFTNQYKSKM